MENFISWLLFGIIGQRNLADYSPWGCKESNTTECAHTHTFPLYPLGKSFYHEWMLNFIKCFFCIFWVNHVIFVFSFVDVVWHINWFVYVEPSFWPWDESNLIMVYGLFLCVVGFSLLMFCWESLRLYSLKMLTCNFVLW